MPGLTPEGWPSDMEDAVWANPKHRDSPEVLRFAERRGLPLKFSPVIPEGSVYVMLPSRLSEPRIIDKNAELE